MVQQLQQQLNLFSGDIAAQHASIVGIRQALAQEQGRASEQRAVALDEVVQLSRAAAQEAQVCDL